LDHYIGKMALLITEKQIKEYKRLFNLFDKDGNGSITTDELAAVFKELGKNITEKELKEMIKKVDCNDNGCIEFDEFIRMLNLKAQSLFKEKEILDAFKAIDQDGNGYLTAEELRQVLTRYGEKLSSEEAENMVRQADIDGDGKVNYEEFVQMVIFK